MVVTGGGGVTGGGVTGGAGVVGVVGVVGVAELVVAAGELPVTPTPEHPPKTNAASIHPARPSRVIPCVVENILSITSILEHKSGAIYAGIGWRQHVVNWGRSYDARRRNYRAHRWVGEIRGALRGAQCGARRGTGFRGMIELAVLTLSVISDNFDGGAHAAEVL
jgi:hypothetical protein